MAAKALIYSPLTYVEGEKPTPMAVETKKEIETIIQLFDDIYDEVYEECLAKPNKGVIQQKADRFNQIIGEFRKKMTPKEELVEINRRIQDARSRKEVKHIAIREGNYDYEATKRVEKRMQGLGER